MLTKRTFFDTGPQKKVKMKYRKHVFLMSHMLKWRRSYTCGIYVINMVEEWSWKLGNYCTISLILARGNCVFCPKMRWTFFSSLWWRLCMIVALYINLSLFSRILKTRLQGYFIRSAWKQNLTYGWHLMWGVTHICMYLCAIFTNFTSFFFRRR